MRESLQLGRWATVLMVVAVPAATSCSGQPTISDWLRQADAVCRTAEEASAADPIAVRPVPGDALRIGVERTRAEVDALRKLDRPREWSTAVSDYLLSLDRRNEVSEEYAKAIDRTPVNAEAPPRELVDRTAEDAANKAQALGLQWCDGGIDPTRSPPDVGPTAPVTSDPTTPRPDSPETTSGYEATTEDK